jgi:hypothetical protein
VLGRTLAPLPSFCGFQIFLLVQFVLLGQVEPSSRDVLKSPPVEVDPSISAPLIGGGVMPGTPPPGTLGVDPRIIPK